MAGIKFVCNTGEVTTGTAAITLMQIVAAANHRVLVHEWEIDFKGISNTAAPIYYRVLVQSTAGTMSALTPVKWDSTYSETLQTTAQHTATAEPAAGSVLMAGEIHPQQGGGWVARFDRPLVIPGGTKLGFEVTAGASTSAVCRALCEE